MASGIKLPGTLVPGTTSGVVVESKYVKGGYITVKTQAERDALLKTEVVTPGTRVYVEAEAIEYVCQTDPATGEKQFRDSVGETAKALEAEGFVTEDAVEEIVKDSAEAMVSEAIETQVPSMVEQQVTEQLDDVTEQITKEATEAAKKETLEQVTQQIEEDYVKQDVLVSTTDPIKKDVTSLQEETAEISDKVDANTQAIESANQKVEEVEKSLGDYYTKTEIDDKVSGVYHYKGSVATQDDLPTEGMSVGDVYNVVDTGMNYAWTASGEWDALGGLFDTSDYYNKEQTDGLVESKADKSDLETKADKTELEDLTSRTETVEDAITYGEF